MRRSLLVRSLSLRSPQERYAVGELAADGFSEAPFDHIRQELRIESEATAEFAYAHVTALLQHLVDLLRYAVQIVPGNFCQLMT